MDSNTTPWTCYLCGKQPDYMMAGERLIPLGDNQVAMVCSECIDKMVRTALAATTSLRDNAPGMGDNTTDGAAEAEVIRAAVEETAAEDAQIAKVADPANKALSLSDYLDALRPFNERWKKAIDARRAAVAAMQGKGESNGQD